MLIRDSTELNTNISMENPKPINKFLLTVFVIIIKSYKLFRFN